MRYQRQTSIPKMHRLFQSHGHLESITIMMKLSSRVERELLDLTTKDVLKTHGPACSKMYYASCQFQLV